MTTERQPRAHRACGQTSEHVTAPCVEPDGHEGFHRTEHGTKWGSPAPGQCWACEDSDYAWFCSACGGHGDDGRVPVVVRCPTIRRCMGYARAWGYDGVEIVNLYALRATDPRELWKADIDPVGEFRGRVNDNIIGMAAGSAAHFNEPLVAAWGANAKADRVERVLKIAAEYRAQFVALGTTKEGHPMHPLYMPRDAELRSWPEVPAHV